MDLIDATAILTGGGRERQETATPTVMDVTTTAEAMSDSVDGLVLIDLGGESITEDDEQAVEAECTCDVREGDMVSVTMTGARGRGRTLTVTGVVGGGDRTHADVVAADTKATEAQETATQAKTDVEQVKPRLETVETSLTQTNEAITLEAEARSATDNALADLTQQLDDETAARQEGQDAIANQLSTEIETRKNWMRFDANGMELGASDSDFKTRLDNQELGFYNGDVEIARAAGDAFEAPKIRAGTVELTPWAWVVAPTGELQLKYIGE